MIYILNYTKSDPKLKLNCCNTGNIKSPDQNFKEVRQRVGKRLTISLLPTLFSFQSKVRTID